MDGIQRALGNQAARGLAERAGTGPPPGEAQALDAGLRSAMEAQFGADFGAVRVYAGPTAASLADEAGATAYTVGSDMVFASGQYAPSTPRGRMLLAHELTHVVQNRSAGEPHDLRPISATGDASEHEATRNSLRAAAGLSVRVDARPSAALAREEPGVAETAYEVFTNDLIGGILGFGDEAKVPGIGPMSQALGPFGIWNGISGMRDAVDDPSTLQGLGDFEAALMSGVSGLAGTVAGASALAPGSAMLARAAGVLTPVGALAGSFAGGYAAGGMLYDHTSVGGHAVDTIGGIDDWLTDEGERSWALRKSESMEEDWDRGGWGYLSALYSGAGLGLAAGVGAFGGIGGGIVDVGSAIGGGIGDAASVIGGGIGDAASAVGGTIGDAASAVGGGIWDAGSAVGGGIGDAASAVGDWLTDW